MKNGSSAGSKWCVVEAVGSEISSRVGFHVKWNSPSTNYWQNDHAHCLCHKNENQIFLSNSSMEMRKKRKQIWLRLKVSYCYLYLLNVSLKQEYPFILCHENHSLPFRFPSNSLWFFKSKQSPVAHKMLLDICKTKGYCMKCHSLMMVRRENWWRFV